MSNKKCFLCGKLSDGDSNFCMHCGSKFPDGVPDGDNKNCPVCNTSNHHENIECMKCGYLLRKDIIRQFYTSGDKNFNQCPECGNILTPGKSVCNICGCDLPDLKIRTDYTGDFFDNCPEYGKNIKFFTDINKTGTYDSYLLEFKNYCIKKDIDMDYSDIGMVKCPDCSGYLSFISPHFIIKNTCPHCGFKFDFKSKARCLNCGRPVMEGQVRCECGYEFRDVECPNCKTYNRYTDTHCIICGIKLKGSGFRLPPSVPWGCQFKNGEAFLDTDILKSELLKDPYAVNGKVSADLLMSEFSKHNMIINEIAARWWIVSPDTCKSCGAKLHPMDVKCVKCDIAHYVGEYQNKILELKTVRDNYVESERNIEELSSLKWTYRLTDPDVIYYLNSLAPTAGESQLEYRQRLFREWIENSFIIYLLKVEWNIYFPDICMNCGTEFEKHNPECPSCGMQKNVPALSVLLSNEYVITEAFPRQFDDFTSNVAEICGDNGGDINYIDNGVVQCPKCSSYFHYLTPEFINTQDCPHCGVHFNFTARIYSTEEDLEGLSYEEYMEQFYDVKF